jgi:hypothetical protein
LVNVLHGFSHVLATHPKTGAVNWLVHHRKNKMHQSTMAINRPFDVGSC